VVAGVPQGSILGPLLFLVYINDLLTGINSNARIFADDTSLFQVSSNNTTSTTILNGDLCTITSWAHQWKMIFNPDISKQAVEVVFSTKLYPTTYDSLIFNTIPVKPVDQTKHLGLTLDKKLSFHTHVNEKIKKARQGIGLMKQIYPYIPRNTLEIVYKLYIRPHLDYADIIFHIPYKDNPAFLSDSDTEPLNNFMRQIESVQYDAALSASGAWKGSPKKELYANLGWESLHLRRELRRLCMLHEIITLKNPSYLYNIINSLLPNSTSRVTNLRPIHTRTEFYHSSFFPSTIEKWNLLDPATKNSPKLVFKNAILKKIRPKRKETFGIIDSDGKKWLTQIRVRLSPLKAHKFHHNFDDTLSPLCNSHDGIEDSEHFLLHCQQFNALRADLFQKLSQLLNINVRTLNNTILHNLLIYGDKDSNNATNKKNLLLTIDFIRRSKRFT
jgi:hypothetical protein